MKEKLAPAILTTIKLIPDNLRQNLEGIPSIINELKEIYSHKPNINLINQLKQSMENSLGPYPVDLLLKDLLANSRFLEPARTAAGIHNRETLQTFGMIAGISLALTPDLHPAIGLGLILTSVADMARNIRLQDKIRQPITKPGRALTTH